MGVAATGVLLKFGPLLETRDKTGGELGGIDGTRVVESESGDEEPCNKVDIADTKLCVVEQLEARSIFERSLQTSPYRILTYYPGSSTRPK